MAVVIDCSVTMAWFFEDEKCPEADKVLDAIIVNEAIVPTIWLLEVTNVLLIAERQKRIEGPDSDRFLTLLNSLPIVFDDDQKDVKSQKILDLGRTHQLSAYDAAYLELANRRSIKLATFDKNLFSAADSLNLALNISMFD